ncbi:hypothetical protein ACE193_13550 [Bernardetia sp. OM2101]|uniref:hypothetical protein n=1 Tax=Bernardetia sp. OM2101 TaxID=3344876 RepID=UPI0035D07365
MKNLLLFFVLFFYTGFAIGQTPVSLPATPPYTQDFNATPAASGTSYPIGWTSYNNTTLDATMINGTTSSTTGANYNYGSRIGLLGSGSNFDPSSIVLAIDNTSGRSGLEISYDIIKIREQTRDCTFNLEYSTTSPTAGFSAVFGGLYNSGSLAEGTVTQKTSIDISALDNQAGTVYLRWSYSSSGGGSRDGIALDNVSVTWNTATPSIDLFFQDAGDANIARGSTNNPIFSTRATVTDGLAILNQVILRTNGTYTTTDIAANGFKIWASTDGSFDGGDTQLASTSSVSGNGETITFSSLSESIPLNTIRYFFVTADITSSATLNNTVGIANTTTADFTFAAPNNKTGTANSGNLHTIIGLNTGIITPTSLCVTVTQGESITVPFTYSPTGIYTGTFTAQLSDATGSFAVPTTIGSVTSDNTGSQSISATISAGTPQGSNYRIRVVSSIPNVEGADNGTDITIDLLTVSISPAGIQTLSEFQNGDVLTATESHSIQSRRWKYSTTSGSGYTNFLGAETTQRPYFETAGTYYMVVETLFNCGKSVISNEVQIDVTPFTGTRLFPGDMAIVGWDASVGGARDEYAITNLVSLKQGTKFIIANATYENGTGANIRSNVWQDGREYIEFVYNRATDLPAGSIISFEFTNLTGDNADNVRINGVAAGPDITSSPGFGSAKPNVSTSGADQIYIMQGNFNSTGTDFDGYVLFGMTNDADWVNFSVNVSSARTSRLHPHIRCINTSHPTGEVGSYFDTTNPALRNADQRTILGYIINMANWTNTSSLPATVHTTVFTVTSPTIKSNWIGDKDENWFDCQNWSSLYVPNRYTNVEFTTTAVGDSRINQSADFSNEYLDIAEVKNIILENRILKMFDNRAARLDVYENLTIQNTGYLDMDDDVGFINDGTINIRGNWINNIGTSNFEEGESLVVFEGGNNQSITTVGGEESFYDVTLNCGRDLTINNETIIKREFLFQSGNVFAATTNPLTFDVDAFYTDANADRHIRGASRRRSNKIEDFTFPIGKIGVYRPLTIHTKNTGTITQFFAEYFFAGYGTYQPVVIPLDHVSQIEYWNLNREVGISDAQITLSWGIESEVGNLGSLVVAHWTNANQWESRGNTMTTGNTTSGTVKSAQDITQFSPFTLGTIDNLNPLPVTWLSFDAKYNQEQDNVFLEWKTLSEYQNQLFAIERSDNGIDFEEIGVKKGNLNARSVKNYQFWDFEPLHTKTYYRIKQTDTNGKFTYSNVRMIETENERKIGVTNYQNKTILYANLKEATKAKVNIYNMNGNIVGMFEVFLKKGQNELLLPLNDISKAVYIYKIGLENQSEFVSGKFLIK